MREVLVDLEDIVLPLITEIKLLIPKATDTQKEIGSGVGENKQSFEIVYFKV